MFDSRQIAFLLRKELGDAGKSIMDCFGAAKFYRDYEDTWEWLEGRTAGGLSVNVSRPHNWKTGEYDRPVRIHVKSRWRREKLFIKDVCAAAQCLADRLGVEVWIGETTGAGNPNTYGFRIRHTFTPNGTASKK
jgi:hypothetical protein